MIVGIRAIVSLPTAADYYFRFRQPSCCFLVSGSNQSIHSLRKSVFNHHHQPFLLLCIFFYRGNGARHGIRCLLKVPRAICCSAIHFGFLPSFSTPKPTHKKVTQKNLCRQHVPARGKFFYQFASFFFSSKHWQREVMKSTGDVDWKNLVDYRHIFSSTPFLTENEFHNNLRTLCRVSPITIWY